MYFHWTCRSSTATDLIVSAVQDKVVSLLFSNYLLWPVTNHIMSKFVPKEQRAGATHVVTVRFICYLFAFYPIQGCAC